MSTISLTNQMTKSQIRLMPTMIVTGSQIIQIAMIITMVFLTIKTKTAMVSMIILTTLMTMMVFLTIKTKTAMVSVIISTSMMTMMVFLTIKKI